MGDNGLMRPGRPPSLRPLSALAVAVLAIAALAACMDDSGTPELPPTTSAPATTPSATPTPTPTPTATPFSADCDTLVPPTALTGLFADFHRVGTYLPPTGSVGDRVLDAKGTVCGWQNAQNQTLMVAVAELDPATLLEMKNELVMTSHSVPTYEVEGYFQVVSGVGEVQAFLDPYWIVTTSVKYAEPGEAQPVVAAALAAVR
jgi:hypothetical protein